MDRPNFTMLTFFAIRLRGNGGQNRINLNDEVPTQKHSLREAEYKESGPQCHCEDAGQHSGIEAA